MKQYNLYAGLSGGFGDASYQGTGWFDSEEEATQEAYYMAISEFESYEGLHGLRTMEDIADEENLDIDSDYEEIQEIYIQERDSWLDYYAVLTEEDDQIDSDEIIEL